MTSTKYVETVDYLFPSLWNWKIIAGDMNIRNVRVCIFLPLLPIQKKFDLAPGRWSHWHAGMQPAEFTRKLHDEILCVTTNAQWPQITNLDRPLSCDDLAILVVRCRGSQGPHCWIYSCQNVCSLRHALCVSFFGAPLSLCSFAIGKKRVRRAQNPMDTSLRYLCYGRIVGWVLRRS